MSAPFVDQRVGTVDERSAPRLAAFLGRPPPGLGRTDALLRHQHLLDALDRREYRRFLVWPGGPEPAAVAHLNPSGTLVLAGSADAAADLADHLHGSGWRVLLGDAPLVERFLEAAPRALRRRRVRARRQRFMATTRPAPLTAPEGLRPAADEDLEVVTDLACRLHVEDRMGPPLSRTARAGVADRMRVSIERSLTWVVERDRAVVAKIDVSLWTRRYGAQIAGVYVDERYRGRGLAAGGVAAVSRELVADGLPGVTLHVRADNAAGRRAYERAGYVDRGEWTLALR